MRVDFCLHSEKMTSAKRFFTCLNWPIANPQKGWEITFAIKSSDPNDNIERLKTGKVTRDEQLSESCVEVWVDMEELAEGLRDNLVEVVGWRTAFTSSDSDRTSTS